MAPSPRDLAPTAPSAAPDARLTHSVRPVRGAGRRSTSGCASAATRSGCATSSSSQVHGTVVRRGRHRRRRAGRRRAVRAARDRAVRRPRSSRVRARRRRAGGHADGDEPGHERRARRRAGSTDPADADGQPAAIVQSARGSSRAQTLDVRRDGDRRWGPVAGSSSSSAARRDASTPRPSDRRAPSRRRRRARVRARRWPHAPARVLMDRYERLERIDYKSARDVVTEADHLSEALILDAIRERYPGDAHPGRGDRRARRRSRARRRRRARPGLDHRPARRDRELRQRHPVLLRLDRAGRRRPAGGRRRPRPDPGRDVRGRGRRAGDAQRARRSRASDKDKLSDFVDLDGARGPAVASRARGGAQGDPRSRARWARRRSRLAYVANGRFDAFIQQGGLSAWDIAAAGLIAERGGATVTAMDGGPWFDLGRKSASRSASSPRRPRTTRRCSALATR